ncbi:transporter substrate-binding domain-containing protein [Chitinivorax sp. B]|uniref:substrate-binding periplasmic protein n=1 Tax=Chitinivorax sp. B TaxID=2502235 RepID=UPI0010F67B7F|nr:transporter substrate-binding domain-containing protein [Chitinivorax sp. B]
MPFCVSKPIQRWLYIYLLLVGNAFANTTVTYPAPESADDVRFRDVIELLKTALDKTAGEMGPAILKPSDSGMTEARYMEELKAGRSINVAWSSTSVDKEKEFIPIRICLRKGLLGYRLSLISKNKQAEIDKVKTLDDLKKLTLGQGIGWGDVKLYEANGIKVTTAKYDGLFPMAAAGRIDLFPRGITEAIDEYEQRKKANPDLVIEKGLLIHYPWPFYIFVNKKDKALADRIEKGFRTMLKDGSYDVIFKKYNQTAIDKGQVKGRRVIEVANPMLPKETPLSDASLWFDPTK